MYSIIIKSENENFTFKITDELSLDEVKNILNSYNLNYEIDDSDNVEFKMKKEEK